MNKGNPTGYLNLADLDSATEDDLDKSKDLYMHNSTNDFHKMKDIFVDPHVPPALKDAIIHEYKLKFDK